MLERLRVSNFPLKKIWRNFQLLTMLRGPNIKQARTHGDTFIVNCAIILTTEKESLDFSIWADWH